MNELCIFQEKDLKQYMDDCGNIMSMTNVKVGEILKLLYIKYCLNSLLLAYYYYMLIFSFAHFVNMCVVVLN